MILILLTLLFTTGCSEDEPRQEKMSIDGQWSLTIYEPGLSPTEDYNTRQIVWNFQNDNILIVKIENTVNTPPILEDGEYSYSLTNDKVIINNLEYDFSLSNSQLIISDDPASDGFRAIFVKMNE